MLTSNSLGLIILELAANVILPDNGHPWLKLRNDDLSDCDFSENCSDRLLHLISRMIKSDYRARITTAELLQEIQA